MGFLVILAGGLFLFNWIMGYPKDTITFDLNDRYVNHKEYIKAVQRELERQGKTVKYTDYCEFLINGKSYLLIE